jgi:hypothetical protein
MGNYFKSLDQRRELEYSHWDTVLIPTLCDWSQRLSTSVTDASSNLPVTTQAARCPSGSATCTSNVPTMLDPWLGKQLIDASHNGDLSEVIRLLDGNGVDVKYEYEEDGSSALMISCSYHDVEVLLKYGADTLIQNTHGKIA